jgi:hypothetical protein
VGNGVQTGEVARSSPAELVRRLVTVRRVMFVVLVLLIVFVARSCQQAQVRVSQERAIAVARRQVDFRPTRMQIRLVRQGINSHPYWAVSLSVPKGTDFSELTVVRVDANTGAVATVDDQRPGSSP